MGSSEINKNNNTYYLPVNNTNILPTLRTAILNLGDNRVIEVPLTSDNGKRIQSENLKFHSLNGGFKTVLNKTIPLIENKVDRGQ